MHSYLVLLIFRSIFVSEEQIQCLTIKKLAIYAFWRSLRSLRNQMPKRHTVTDMSLDFFLLSNVCDCVICNFHQKRHLKCTFAKRKDENKILALTEKTYTFQDYDWRQKVHFLDFFLDFLPGLYTAKNPANLIDYRTFLFFVLLNESS